VETLKKAANWAWMLVLALGGAVWFLVSRNKRLETEIQIEKSDKANAVMLDALEKAKGNADAKEKSFRDLDRELQSQLGKSGLPEDP
jgi:hypothetical protein